MGLRFVVGISALLGVAAFSSCNGDESGKADDGRPTIAFVTNCVDPFWKPGKVGAEKAGADFGVDVEVLMPSDGTPVQQKQYIEDLLSRGVAGIAISPIDPENQGNVLDMAASKVPLVTHDSDAPNSKRRCFIGVDNYEAGLMCGELVREALPDGGKIMLFIGNLSQDNSKRRRQGVIDAVLGRKPDPTRYDTPGTELSDADGKYVVLGTLMDNMDRLKAKANAEDAMNANTDLAAMVGLFNSNPPMCLEAVRRSGKLGKVKIIGFDEAEETLQGIVDGHVHGTVVQDPFGYGYQSVKMLAAMAGVEAAGEGEVPAGGVLKVPARRIDQSNVKAFWDDLKEKLAAADK